jgi:Glycosyl hydrolases family 28
LHRPGDSRKLADSECRLTPSENPPHPVKSHLTLGALFLGAAATLTAAPPLPILPEWASHVGAQRAPSSDRVFDANSYGAVGDGKALETAAVQGAIDACAAAGGGVVTLHPGTYVCGALFVKSHVNLQVGDGVTIMATLDETAYPLMPTRVAGIEMPWPAALLNVINQEDVEISGNGSIDGRGDFWWKKYGDLRKRYEPLGIRWAADYDCQRVRLVVVFGSKDVTLSGLSLHRSGFWNVQVTYSDRITVDGIRITDNFAVGGVRAASTDGVDIDSSRRVLVQNCDIDNNDDDICLKAGRDFDGLRVNRPTEYVVIRDCTCRRGGGVVTFGSETSGGIRHVVAYHCAGIGTGEGLRFKSTRTRGGTVEDVLALGITLTGVRQDFTFDLDWNPSYSYAKIPAGMRDHPAYWTTLTTPVEPPERGYPKFRDITIASVTATGAKRILVAGGMAGDPIGAVNWIDVTAQGQQAGEIEQARNWTMTNVHFLADDGAPVKVTACEDVASPDTEPVKN